MSRMLIVDDQREVCEFIADVAGDLGFETRIATKHRDFIALYHDFKPEVMVLDLSMPEFDGIEVMWLLADWGSRVRLLLVSGYDARLLNSARTLAQRGGLKVVNALTKPLDVDVLSREMTRLMNPHDDDDELALVNAPRR